MNGTTLTQLIPVLQVAVGPVILISGVGLLLLSMTNRLGRVVDRARALGRELRTAEAADRATLLTQLAILDRRSGLLNLAITCVSLSVLLAAVLVAILFAFAFAGIESAALVVVVFTGCLGSLIVGLAVFLRDVNLSLDALRHEIARDREAAGRA
ncbi:MAG TPA: DUF2721 domain-containing protein [Candidatus Polarisedimenticolaceae bacterium]